MEAADGGAAAGSGSGSEADLDARVRLYERVASEVVAYAKCKNQSEALLCRDAACTTALWKQPAFND